MCSTVSIPETFIDKIVRIQPYLLEFKGFVHIYKYKHMVASRDVNYLKYIYFKCKYKMQNTHFYFIFEILFF